MHTKLNRTAIGMFALMTFLLALSAGAQITSTSAPMTPPPKDTTKRTTAPARTSHKTTGQHATRTHQTVAHQTHQKTTKPAATSTPAATTSSSQTKGAFGPGAKASADGKLRECKPNDPSPEGTVIDGYRKVMVPSPLMPHACQWRAVE